MHCAPFLPLIAVYVLAAPAPAVQGPTWTQVRDIVRQLKSPEATAAMIQGSPLLQATYADPELFTGTLAKWRSRFTLLPADPDQLDPDQTTVEVRDGLGGLTVSLTFRDQETEGRLTFLKLSWAHQGLARVDCYGGFVRVTPLQQFYNWPGSVRSVQSHRP